MALAPEFQKAADTMAEQLNSIGAEAKALIEKATRSDASGIEQGARDVAERMAAAEVNTIKTIAGLGGMSTSDARAAFTKMVNLKVLKLDLTNQRYTPTNGAYFDSDVLRRAAGLRADASTPTIKKNPYDLSTPWRFIYQGKTFKYKTEYEARDAFQNTTGRSANSSDYEGDYGPGGKAK